MKQNNAKAIKSLLKELHGLMAEENGWEPRTSRDYAVLTWATVKELREDVKPLTSRITRLEVYAVLVGGSLIVLAAQMIFGV